MIGQIILQILIIALIAVFTAAETAAININDTRLEKLSASGNKRAAVLKKLIDTPTHFISTMKVVVTLAGYLGAAFTADCFSEKMVAVLEKLNTGFPHAVLKGVSIVLITLVLTYFTLVFGKFVPKRLAMNDCEKTALRLSGFLRFITLFFAPFIFILNISTNGILRLLGIDPTSDEETVTEEEIIMMSDAGAEKGTIDEDENRIIKNIFAFDDLTAEQVCTHRTDVSVLWSNDDISVWEKTIHRTRHSVFPICGESVDNVIGVLDAKDYFRTDSKTRESIMENAVREPFFVHENMKADRLFEQMKKNGSDHFAIVVDEYGGMSGIITITDLVEQLVGDFADDPEDEPAVKLEKTGDNQWTVPGICSLSDVCEKLDIELPADKYDTFGGYVIAELGEIPKNGSQVSLDTDILHIDVIEVKHHRIEVCRVALKNRSKVSD